MTNCPYICVKCLLCRRVEIVGKVRQGILSIKVQRLCLPLKYFSFLWLETFDFELFWWLLSTRHRMNFTSCVIFWRGKMKSLVYRGNESITFPAPQNKSIKKWNLSTMIMLDNSCRYLEIFFLVLIKICSVYSEPTKLSFNPTNTLAVVSALYYHNIIILSYLLK